MILNEPILKNSGNNSNLLEKNNIDVALWMRFLQELKLSKMFAEIPDPRQQSKVTYPLSSLIHWALAACAFRQGSKNAMQTTLDGLSLQKKAGIVQLLGSHEKCPCSSTVDSVLAQIEYENFNQILLKLFDRLHEKKFFYNHVELLPDNIFHIGADGFWTHHYTTPHTADEEGHNTCPYCLPRKHNVGTPNESVTWVHVCVTFMLICEGITLPLYICPLKAKQVNTNQSDDGLKQECEATATKAVLPMLRERYPKLEFTFLGDSLYANKPFIKLCNEIKFDYVIVLKETTLKLLNQKCNELAKTEFYQQHYTYEEAKLAEDTIELTHRKAEWFNHAAAGDNVYTNVLRFEETIQNQNDNSTSYRGAWICSKKIFQHNCFKSAKTGRSRWNQEDFHNTAKNRGFSIQHDMARADPNLLMVWKLMVFIAFFAFELFRYSTVAIAARQTRSLMKFAQDMLEQLVNIAWETIQGSIILQKCRVQFRFNFSPGP